MNMFHYSYMENIFLYSNIFLFLYVPMVKETANVIKDLDYFGFSGRLNVTTCVFYQSKIKGSKKGEEM